MLIFDAHLDLSMNALEWNRDLTRPLDEIRAREKDMTDRRDRGHGTVCLPEMRKAGIGICIATQIGRYVKRSNPLSGWHSPEQAWAQTQGQLAWYRAMEERGEMLQITGRKGLEEAEKVWQDALENQTATATQPPIHYLLSLEGADSMVTLKHVERSFEQGLRALGPAHYGLGTYAQGTDATGGLGPKGPDLLREMSRLGIILDATHLCDDSFWEAMDIFEGPVWASHSNCRTLVDHNRQFSDEQLKHLIERGAVIGGVLDAWMLAPGWKKFETLPEEAGVKLEHLVDHIDHVCQLAGNSLHSGIGTDLDGGYGTEQTPMDLDSIADLQRLPEIFKNRGYSDHDIANIMHGNFLRFLKTHLP